MTYNQKYYEEIFEQMLNDSLEKGLISHANEFKSYIQNKEDISNYYVMDKSVIAEMFAIFYEDLTTVYKSPKIEYATSSDLDDIGDIVAVPRPGATCAEVEVKFTLEGELTEPISIPSGVIVATENDIQYITLEEIYFDESTTEFIVQCRSVEAGVDYKVLENTLTNIVSTLDLDYTLSCINPEASSGGTNEYSDEEYRDLLKKWKEINLKGSLEAYEYYFANFDGIDGYKLIPNWDGSGTMKIIIDPGTSEQLNLAYNELNTTVTQATESLVMFSPEDKLIDVVAVVNCDIDLINPYSSKEKEIIQSKIIQSIKTFIDGGYKQDGEYYPGLLIGEDFISHKLAVFIDSEISEIKDIHFDYPESYISITDEEKGKSNNISIEMV